jgi:hypothetical protein
MRTTVLAVVVLLCAERTFAQGNIGAPELQRRFEKAYLDTLEISKPDSVTAKLTTYRMTGDREADVNDAGLLGEANVAALGSSAVKPAVMVRGLFRRGDYLALMAQLLFGDTGADSSRDDFSKNMFVPEASQYALNILGIWRPGSKKRTAKEFAVNFGFYYALKQLPPDSTQTERVNTGVIHGHLGVEYLVFPRNFSIYVNAHVLSDQEGVDNFRGYFGTEAEQTFTYVAPGLRVKVADSVFVDCELIVMTDDMKRLSGTADGVLPIIRLGFSQSVFGLD